MEVVQRKITYKLDPNSAQSALLMEALALHCRTYNALLEEHKRRYEAEESAFSFFAMCKEITNWRGYADSLKGVNAHASHRQACRIGFQRILSPS